MIQRLALALAITTPIALLDGGPARADTPPASATSPTSTPARTGTYKVKSGDGLAAIARKLGVRLADLLAVNGITITSTIHPGQTLKVPATSSTASRSGGSGGTATPQAYNGATNAYTVKAGDSLFGIARKHGVSLNSLLAANSFVITSTILPGQTINVPVPQSATQSAATASTSTPGASATASPIDTLISYLRQQVGKPYKFFTAGPDTFDCSGLVVAGYRQIGRSLPHQSRMQSTVGTEVDFRNVPITAGDLIFMVSSVDPTRIGHVGIALDSSTWIQAVATGIPVSIKPIPNADRISAVRRIVNV
jgi:peptidoglycan endopeptidase LytE